MQISANSGYFWGAVTDLCILDPKKMDYFSQESEHLRFRRMLPTDVDNWSEFFVDNSFLPYLGVEEGKDPLTLSGEWLARQEERYRLYGLGHLVVEEKASGELIGMGGIIPRDLEQREYEIAYSLKPAHWRRGYGTEIARQMKQYGIQAGIATSFISIIHKENIASQKVARNNGMSIRYETNFLGMPVYIFSDPAMVAEKDVKNLY